MTLQHGIIPAQSLTEDDRVMCRYVGDTPLDVCTIYTVSSTITIGSEHYVTLDDAHEGPWARWRFEKVIGGQ
jgi:hypothetical protein